MAAPFSLNAGELDRRLVLQRNSPVTNGLGEPVDNWLPITSGCACQKIELGGIERIRADAEAGVTTVRFVVRWARLISDLSTADRLTFEGRVFNIVKVAELGRRVALQIDAQAKADVAPNLSL